MSPPIVHVLDYGAGNVRSLLNALSVMGFQPQIIQHPDELATVSLLVFPGVGAFGSAMHFLESHHYVEPLRVYLANPAKRYLGICIGMQVLFESSEESPGVQGLGVIKGTITRFPSGPKDPSVPQIGWNGLWPVQPSSMFSRLQPEDRVYFVHSYRAATAPSEWVAATTRYGSASYVSAVQRGRVAAVQFHPEKSGKVGLQLVQDFLNEAPLACRQAGTFAGLSRRIVACLDVRSNDEGDLVVTKGDSYDVREAKQPDAKKGRVRNLGKPVELARRYYEVGGLVSARSRGLTPCVKGELLPRRNSPRQEGADEVTFLNITSFRSEPLEDAPLLAVLEEASRSVFVPLTIGGGIRDYTDAKGEHYSALQVADRYFRAGADKVSIGGDAVLAAEKLRDSGRCDGSSSIEQISRAYGAQAVVISVDPRRVYLQSEEDETKARDRGHTIVEAEDLREGKAGEKAKVWYQCTVKGGREGRDLDAVALCRLCERLGAGEILLNSIDCDGQKKGFDLALVRAVCAATRLPVIASSGAGSAAHFVDVFQGTRAEAALAAGIFHRHEVPLAEVKAAVRAAGLPVRADSRPA